MSAALRSPYRFRLSKQQELAQLLCIQAEADRLIEMGDIKQAEVLCLTGTKAPEQIPREWWHPAGAPFATGPYAGKPDEAFAVWRARIQEVASLPNTYVKLGGLGMKMIGFDFVEKPEPPSSRDLAETWRP